MSTAIRHFLCSPIVIFYIIFSPDLLSQNLKSLEFDLGPGVNFQRGFFSDGPAIQFSKSFPVFSCEIDDNLTVPQLVNFSDDGKTCKFFLGEGIEGEIKFDNNFAPGLRYLVSINNDTYDTIHISNLVPLGREDDHIYITASGPWSLARTKIFRPGLGPVGIIVPDNAWELGYSAIELKEGLSLCLLSRRTGIEKAQKRRWETIIYPGGSVNYVIYADVYKGIWQNGLELMFRKRYLYDLDKFDYSLYEREDLKWIRDKYIITLQFAWNHDFYDGRAQKYKVFEYLEKGRQLFGGYDVFGIWPTWPTLGLDQRNQWDLYRDLPGGLDYLKSIVRKMREEEVEFFISYNPWDQSTRQENPYKGMANLIAATDAAGVVLDTRGSSSIELQNAADSVKPGVIMYSEGMAVPKDMPGIVAGRVHDAIFLPPPINMNKFIKPDHAIYRVCQLNQGRLHREFAISLFNGIGIEMNTFGPGRPDWIEDEYKYLGRTTMILRENSSLFTGLNWIPLLPSRVDSIWVNKWPGENKTVFTIYSLVPEGYNGALFLLEENSGRHFVSLWNHEELKIDTISNKLYAPVNVQSFNRDWLGTRMEGNVDVVASFPGLLDAKLSGDSLYFGSNNGTKILLWAGMPSYQNKSMEFDPGSYGISLYEAFFRYEGKFVIQLFEHKEIIDERVVYFEPGTPRLINKVISTPLADKIPPGMVEIPHGEFVFYIDKEESFIKYPEYPVNKKLMMKKFYMDKYPVTNDEYYNFIKATGYLPADTVNYLKNWNGEKYPEGMGNYPVVYVNYDDVKAYADWAGKRLPTEIEWQYAAQGNDKRLWPWGDEFDSTKCNYALDYLTPVNKFDSGANRFGVVDLVGNVWQLTNDLYDNGSCFYIIIRGGSYYKPTSSWWYVQGGPQQLDKTQMLLRVSPGFERNATIGFRCVKDAE